MVYAGSKALSRAFNGVGIKINATDLSELTEEVVNDACKVRIVAKEINLSHLEFKIMTRVGCYTLTYSHNQHASKIL